MKKVFALKYMPFYLVVLIALPKVLGTYLEIQTTEITVTEQGTVLSCASDITIQKANDITDYNQHVAPSEGLQSQICTFDRIFSGSDSDLAHLFKFSDDVLESPLVMRPDIAQYFYGKIIAANPDDALSTYLKIYTLEKQN